MFFSALFLSSGSKGITLACGPRQRPQYPDTRGVRHCLIESPLWQLFHSRRSVFSTFPPGLEVPKVPPLPPRLSSPTGFSFHPLWWRLELPEDATAPQCGSGKGANKCSQHRQPWLSGSIVPLPNSWPLGNLEIYYSVGGKRQRTSRHEAKGFMLTGLKCVWTFAHPSDFLGCGWGHPRRFHYFLDRRWRWWHWDPFSFPLVHWGGEAW